MRIGTFDRIAAAAIIVSTVFSIIVAITSWEWFPTPGDWGDIAHIPNTMLNYTALLLPPMTVLLYLLIRRLYFKKE
jgi:uncharacterized membrane protein YphA (DoxX/SURF4 family)